MWVQLRFGTWAGLAALFRGWKRYQTRAKRWRVRGGRRRNSSSTAPVIRLKYPPFAFCLSPALSLDPVSLPPTSVTPLSISSPSVRSQPLQKSSASRPWTSVQRGMHSGNRKFWQGGGGIHRFFCSCFGNLLQVSVLLHRRISSSSQSFTGSHPLQVLLWGWLVQIVSMLAFAPCSVQFHVCRSRGSPQADTGVLWRWSSPLENPAGTQKSASPRGPSSSRKAWARARRWGTLKGTASYSHVLPGREPHD